MRCFYPAQAGNGRDSLLGCLLGLKPGTLALQPLDLELLRLHLSVAGGGLHRVGAGFLHPLPSTFS